MLARAVTPVLLMACTLGAAPLLGRIAIGGGRHLYLEQHYRHADYVAVTAFISYQRPPAFEMNEDFAHSHQSVSFVEEPPIAQNAHIGLLRGMTPSRDRASASD